MIIFIFIFIFFVPQAGIEPAHPKAYVPKTYVSTKFHHWGLYVDSLGYAPSPPDFQSSASTKLAWNPLEGQL